MTYERVLQCLAGQQHGLASRSQLLEMGYTRHQIATRTASGVWQRVAPSVYDVAPASFDPRRALHAAVLASSGWASHRSAAGLWGLIDCPAPRPELVVPEGRHRQGITANLYQARNLLPRDLTVVDGIACTSVNRTLIDLGRVVGSELVETAVSRAIGDGRTSLANLRRYFGSNLPPPQYQYPLRLDGRRYRLDMAWPAERVFLEADGFGFHSERAQFVGDRERQNVLVAAGWLPLRYTWNAARRSPSQMVAQVGEVLRSRRP